ncbi:MAG: hypothetical protein QUV12_02890 [Blastomonas fulva]|nr:hypothetical protein [Blastomonas fulva]
MSDWQEEMADIIAEVARNLLAKHGMNNRGILLLSSLSLDGVTYNVFIGKESTIEYSLVVDDDMENVELMRDFKYTAPTKNRCEAVEMFIKDGKASTKLLYKGDIEPEYEFDRRDEVVFSYFGKHPIIYPPMPFGTWDVEL